MWKSLFACVMPVLCTSTCLAAELTALEQRWLKGIAPVVAFARQAKFPLTIVVQPQPTPGLTPLGMAFVKGRCTLVLSMRGNPKAQAMIDRIEPELLAATLELMAAHELGHCERYLEGAFARKPAGFNATKEPPGLGSEEQAAYLSMKTMRREEGYADLIGLAWTRHRHPALYARLHAWLVAERSSDTSRGSEHDTNAWLQLVRDSAVLADPAMFGNATAVWARGLSEEE